MPKILIAGYHGFGNCGDEAILMAMKNNIQALCGDAGICGGVSLCALSFTPCETERIYGIKSVDRFRPIKVLRAIAGTDILILGGGSLLQDETSVRSLMYYLAIIFAAKLLGKKVMLYSNGIGPVSRKISKLLIKHVVNGTDLITLREDASLRELKKLGVTKPPVYVTADPAFTLSGCGCEKARAFLEDEGVPLDRPLAGVSVRPWKKSSAFSEKIAALCDYICEKHNTNILFIPMQRGPDTRISKEIMEKMKNRSFLLSRNYGSDEILGITGVLDVMLSMRLHSLIFAGVKNVPMLGFVYDPKVKNFLELLETPDAGGIESLDLAHLKERADDLFLNNAKYRAELKNKTDALKEKAKLNDELLKGLLSDSTIGVIVNER